MPMHVDLQDVCHLSFLFPGDLFGPLHRVFFATGIPRVRFSHTVPEPAKTVPCTGMGTYQPVIFAVYQETRGILITRGYFSCIISLNIYYKLLQCKKKCPRLL